MKNIMTKVSPAQSCQPCLTTRLFFIMLIKHTKLFWKNFRNELKSASTINQAACFISAQESIAPEQREKLHEALEAVRKKHGLQPDTYTCMKKRVMNHDNASH